MGRDKHLLLVSSDVRVLQTRKLMLGAYFNVYPAVRVGEAIRLMAERRFDLIILCYSVNVGDCSKILAEAQKLSQPARVMMISPHAHASRAIANAIHVSLDDGPIGLLKRSAEALGFAFRTKGRLIHALQPRPAREVSLERCA
jgi:DNA-binding NtrC family response regulator